MPDLFIYGVYVYVRSFFLCVHVCVRASLSSFLIRRYALFPLAQDSPTNTSSWRGLCVRGVAGASGP